MYIILGSYQSSGGGSVDLNAQTSSIHETFAPNSDSQSSGTVQKAHSYGQNQSSLHITTPLLHINSPNTNNKSNIRVHNGESTPHIASGYSSSVTYSGALKTNTNINGDDSGVRYTNSHAGFDAGILKENLIHDIDEEKSKSNDKKTSSTYRNTVYDASIHIQSADKIKCKKEVTGLFSHPFDCSKFINCKNGRTDIQDCGPGTVFNSKSNECDWAKNVQCDQKNPKDYFESRKLSRYGAARTANLYEGDNGYESSVDIDETANETEPDSTYDRNGRRIKCEKYATGLFPHPENCKKFLHCDNGRTFIQNCGPGTAYNAEYQICDWPKNVDCGDREYDVNERRNDPKINVGADSVYGEGSISEYLRPGGKTITVDHEARRYDASNSYSQIRRAHESYQDNNGKDTTASENEYGVKCEQGMIGLNEHPFRCDQFLNCDGTASLVQNCAPGTLFNVKAKICDFPRNVMCGNRGVPAKTQPLPPQPPQYPKVNQYAGGSYSPSTTNNRRPLHESHDIKINGTKSSTSPPPLLRTTTATNFDFSDQNIQNQHQGMHTDRWTTNAQDSNTANAIPKPVATFPIPDMSKVPLAELPAITYPTETIPQTTTPKPPYIYHSDKRVSAGGDVPTEDFDLQQAGFWPFNRQPNSYDTPLDVHKPTEVHKPTDVLPLKQNRNKTFSTGRDHIQPIYHRPLVQNVSLPEPLAAANYNTAYYKPTTESQATPNIQTDYLPLSEALKLLMRPYISKNGTTDVKDVPILHHTRTMEEKILDMADQRKNYRTEHTVSLEQDSLASVDFDHTIKYAEPDSDDQELMPTTTPIIPKNVTTTRKPIITDQKHDENCTHYHPPHVQRRLRPTFVHSPEFHRHDHKHWSSGHGHWRPTNQQPDTNDGTENNGSPSFTGWNYHQRPHHHHNHHHGSGGFQHDPNHPYHRNHPIPGSSRYPFHHSSNPHIGPNHPDFQHDPNHPYHRHHPVPNNNRRNYYPDGSTEPRTAPNPNFDIRFGNDGSTQPTSFPRDRLSPLDVNEPRAELVCNQFNCQNGLCLPFNKVSQYIVKFKS